MESPIRRALFFRLQTVYFLFNTIEKNPIIIYNMVIRKFPDGYKIRID